MECHHAYGCDRVNQEPLTQGRGLTCLSPIEKQMPVYEYQCGNCEKITEVFKPMSKASEEFELCRFCTGIARRIFSKVGVVCRWGTGIVGKQRVGYTDGVDDPEKEIRADMKALEEKAQHADDPKKRHDYKEALGNFTEAHEEILR